MNFVYRQLKVHAPAFRSGFFEGIVADLQKRDGLGDDEVRLLLQKADPEFLDLARADAINGWDLAGAMFTPDYYVDLYAQPPGSDYAKELGKRLDDLDFIIDWCRKREIIPVIVLLHPAIVADARYQDYFRRLGYTLPAIDGTPMVLIERLTRHLAERRVAHMDTLAPLRSSGQDNFIANDVHLNSAGQFIVGKALYGLLKERGILTVPTR